MIIIDDKFWMAEALKAAEQAYRQEKCRWVQFGRGDREVARTYNLRETLQDPAHAEILALREGARCGDTGG